MPTNLHHDSGNFGGGGGVNLVQRKADSSPEWVPNPANARRLLAACGGREPASCRLSPSYIWVSGDVVDKQPDDFVDTLLDLQDLFGWNLTNDLPRTGVCHLDDELSGIFVN